MSGLGIWLAGVSSVVLFSVLELLLMLGVLLMAWMHAA
jgi:hypothetical protein